MHLKMKKKLLFKIPSVGHFGGQMVGRLVSHTLRKGREVALPRSFHRSTHYFPCAKDMERKGGADFILPSHNISSVSSESPLGGSHFL